MKMIGWGRTPDLFNDGHELESWESNWISLRLHGDNLLLLKVPYIIEGTHSHKNTAVYFSIGEDV
jgi:hypothetical protein